MDILEEAEEQYNRPGRSFDYHRRRVFLELKKEVERLRVPGEWINSLQFQLDQLKIDKRKNAELWQETKAQLEAVTKERDELNEFYQMAQKEIWSCDETTTVGQAKVNIALQVLKKENAELKGRLRTEGVLLQASEKKVEELEGEIKKFIYDETGDPT